MTKQQSLNYKRFAKQGCKENGIKVNMKDMMLLESSSGFSDGLLFFDGDEEHIISYVMFEDTKTSRQYCVRYGCKYFDYDRRTLFNVELYK